MKNLYFIWIFTNEKNFEDCNLKHIHFKTSIRYDGTSGKFTAEVAGLYHFMVFVRSQGGNSNEDDFSILKNGNIQCTSRTEGAETDGVEIVATCAATMDLVPGDEVYVSCVDTNAIGGDSRSGFTGFLTKPYL